MRRTCVSTAENAAAAEAAVRLAACASDIIELAAFRARAAQLAALAAAEHWQLPATGQLLRARDGLALCVRPDRWLLLSQPAAAGTAAAAWTSTCAGTAAVIEHSSALAVLRLSGGAACAVLARGCRIDLDPRSFPRGSAAATVIAQVSVILAALGSGLLLITPASTARHLREWLTLTGRPFGLESRPDASVDFLAGDSCA
jgi:heterotetrameric sarcosine oxidase gamma subunit